MATISALTTYPQRGVMRVVWSNLGGADSDVGDWQEIPAYGDKTIHVYGTFGTSTVDIEGSNEDGTPANAVDIEDGGGTALTALAANTVVAVRDNPRKIRPVVNGGNGTGITIILECSTTR
jgi:hypothetical protein